MNSSRLLTRNQRPEEGAERFQVLIEKNCLPRTPHTVKYLPGTKRKIKKFSEKGKLREFTASRFPLKKKKKKVTGVSINRRKMTIEKTLKHQDGRKNMLSRNWVNTIGFPYPLEIYNHFHC